MLPEGNMKVLYAALRHDPRNPDLSSGADYNFYSVIKRHAMEVKIVGPFNAPPPLPERALKKFYMKITRKRYSKWDLYSVVRSSWAVNRAEREWKPDIVFTIFPAPLAFYDGKSPCIFVTDLTFQAWQEGGAGFGELALNFLVWLERRAVKKSTKIIVYSEWAKEEIMKRHRMIGDKIMVLPIPSALPSHVVPEALDISSEKKLESPIRLLLIGKEFIRKGVDIAIETVRLLNEKGVKAELTVCATAGPASPYVRYVGPYRKSVPEELQQYAELYRRAHFLIHPARFDPSPTVPAEAAGFGVPTLINDICGCATSVKDGVSGIVLPKHSAPEAYVKVIQGLLKNPERYNELCRTARQRYENEQNWEVAGKKVIQILKEVTQGRQSH
jgi:glycosyltransferase involved in cell wall biosynthesis